MRMLRSICVFCGSSLGRRPAYVEAAKTLGQLLSELKIELIYGGGNCGLMGVLASEVLQTGGRVVGVIPEDLLARELGHDQLTELHIVRTMHERKALMSSRADGFIALPGGFGTLEELLEVMTWAQLGLHRKPIGVLNVTGYYDLLFRLIDQAIDEEFIPRDRSSLLIRSDSPRQLLEMLGDFQPHDVIVRDSDRETRRAMETELLGSG